MAAYASTTTSLLRRAVPLGDVTGVAMYAGDFNLTNYNATTKPEITDITGKFKQVLSVTFAVSDSGYVFRWDNANGTVEAFSSGGTAGAALAEEATDTDVGSASFIAIGLV